MSYIEKEKVLSAVCSGCNKEFSDEPCEPDACAIRQAIDDIPSADVVEVEHGYWIDDMKDLSTVAGIEMKSLVGYRCSVCGRPEFIKELYCNCGAKMDGGKEE